MTRWTLRAAALLLTVIALVAVMAVLRGSFGPVEGRIVASAVILLTASAIGAVGLQSRAVGAAPRIGVATAVMAALAASLGTATVWAGSAGEDSWLPRAATICAIGSLTLGLHSALLAWLDEPRRLAQGIVALAYLAGADAASIVARESGGTVVEARLLGAALILIVLGIVLLPILGRLQAERARSTSTHA